MKVRSAIVGACVLIVLMAAGAAQSLSGSNTVASDDIINGQVYGPDLHDRSVTTAKIANGQVKTDDIADDAVTRAKLAVPALSDSFVQVAEHSLSPGQNGSFEVTCPGQRPVVLGGGYSFSGGAGFAVWGTFPTGAALLGIPEKWTVSGANTLPQARVLTVYAVCAAAG